MNIKGFVLDHAGHFAIADIPLLLTSALIAGGLTAGLALFGGSSRGPESRRTILLAVTSSLAVGFVRSQLPLALALLALAILYGGRERPGRVDPVHAGALLIGFGCGSGASLITVLVAVPYVLVVRWALKAGPNS